MRRASFGDVADIGVLVGERGSAAFEDLLLVDVQPNAGGRLGRGLNAQSGGQLDVTRGRIETAHQVGVNLL
ncbi:MAG: hypothetical protein GWO04_14455, partial [Actinobacteria bacterium]|nr:hypothetical protein [Actinomycetota bacterium]